MWDDLVMLMRVGVERGRIDTVRPEHEPVAMGREPRADDHGGEVYVYRRDQQGCLVCDTPIRRRVIAGRNLFWCPPLPVRSIGFQFVMSDLRRALRHVTRYLDTRLVRWRTGTSEGQVAVVVVLLVMAVAILVGSLFSYSIFPAATFVIPLLLGAMTLRYRPLLALVTGIFVCIAITVTREFVRAGDLGLDGMTARPDQHAGHDAARRGDRALRVEPPPQRSARPAGRGDAGRPA